MKSVRIMWGDRGRRRTENTKIRDECLNGVIRVLELPDPAIVRGIIGRLCQGGIDETVMNSIREYLNEHNVVLDKCEFASLMEALSTTGNPNDAVQILKFIKYILRQGEVFNAQGLADPAFLEVIFQHFPQKHAICVITLLVESPDEESKGATHVAKEVFKFHSRRNFLSFLSESSLNLPFLIRFIRAFTLYTTDFYSMLTSAVSPIIHFALESKDPAVVCQSLDFLCDASMYDRNLCNDIVFHESFAYLFIVNESSAPTIHTRAVILRNAVKMSSDIRPILISDGEIILNFIKASCSMGDDSLVSICVEIVGLIAQLGELFTNRLFDNGFHVFLFEVSEKEVSMATLGYVAWAFSCMCIFSTIEQRTAIVMSGFGDFIIDTIASLHEEVLVPLLRNLLDAAEPGDHISVLLCSELFTAALDEIETADERILLLRHEIFEYVSKL